MAIKVKVKVKQREPSVRFPALRVWKADIDSTDLPEGPLVVLFTSEYTGVILSGRPDCEIGTSEGWKSVHDGEWNPCSFKMTSID